MRARTLIAPSLMSLMMIAVGILITALPVLHFAVHRLTGLAPLPYSATQIRFQLRCRIAGAAIKRKAAGTGQARPVHVLEHPPEMPEFRSVFNGNSSVSRLTSIRPGETPARRLNTIYHGMFGESSKIFFPSLLTHEKFFTRSIPATCAYTSARFIHLKGVLVGRFKGSSQ